MKRITLFVFLVVALLLSGCFKDDDLDVYHITFKANGVSKDFTTNFGFNYSDDGSEQYYLCSWQLDDYSGLDKNSILLSIPKGYAFGGSTLDQDTAEFAFYYSDNSGEDYSLNDSHDFTLNILSWGNKMVKATFSGLLYSYGVSDTISITDGKFEVEIQ